MRNVPTHPRFRTSTIAPTRRSLVGASIMFIVALTALSATPASAAGTQPNAIHASGAPSAGSTHGTYSVSATASSGDTVTIALDKSSSGCAFSAGKVTFTGAGTCVIDFNDAGNSTYAAAPQVTQSIKVYAANTISTSSFPSAGSTGGSYAPGATATSGDKVVMTLGQYSTGCSLNGPWVDFTGQGTCKVNFNDPGNGAFAAASGVQKSVKVYSANTIYVSTAPAMGTIHATYAPSTSATSGDKVQVTLNSASTGCSLSDAKVTFTGNGVCVVEFNDPGNGAFAAAGEVKQEITVGSGNPKPQSSITVTSVSTTFGHPLVLVAVGGSGEGAMSFAVTSAGTAGCVIDGDALVSARFGTCVVTASKAGDGTYEAASSTATLITIVRPAPRAVRVATAVWSGRVNSTRIIGSNFYGRPFIVTNSVGISAVVTHDNGRILTIRVLVVRGKHAGHYRFTIIFAHGQRTSLRYILR